MYGIARTGAKGELLTLIGSQSSDSGGNSMAPAAMINPAVRPTKVDRASDVTGLVDTGELGTLFSESGRRGCGHGIDGRADPPQARRGAAPLMANDAALKEFNKCGYVKSAYLAERFNDPASLDPALDAQCRGRGRHLHAGRIRRRRANSRRPPP